MADLCARPPTCNARPPASTQSNYIEMYDRSACKIYNSCFPMRSLHFCTLGANKVNKSTVWYDGKCDVSAVQYINFLLPSTVCRDSFKFCMTITPRLAHRSIYIWTCALYNGCQKIQHIIRWFLNNIYYWICEN